MIPASLLFLSLSFVFRGPLTKLKERRFKRTEFLEVSGPGLPVKVQETGGRILYTRSYGRPPRPHPRSFRLSSLWFLVSKRAVAFFYLLFGSTKNSLEIVLPDYFRSWSIHRKLGGHLHFPI
jgi:hypothetical protein